MGKINVLGFEVANLIAAGEVVERPASVLKELLENAIDAGATQITAEIKHGGVSLMRVSDNGCGMTAEDLPLAIRRHATSKIQSAEDLDSIATLGFRGEALAAIAAVSKLTILTKTKSAQMGTMLSSDGGVVTDLCEVGCADGTTVVVEQLFADVPARRKFLKKDRTEAAAAGALLEKMAISHPEISFRFVSDNECRFVTEGDGDTKHTLYALYGKDFASNLLSVDGMQGGVEVKGFVGSSQNTRGNRGYQNVFINGRYVKSRTVMAALEEAFTSYIAPERYPVCCLYLTIDHSKVDVNVHPAKTEVRFSDERPVFEAVYWAVRSALEQNTGRPELKLDERLQKGQALAHSYAPVVGKGEKPVQMTLTPPLKAKPPQTVSPTPTVASPKESVQTIERMYSTMEDSGLMSASLGSSFHKSPQPSAIEWGFGANKSLQNSNNPSNPPVKAEEIPPAFAPATPTVEQTPPPFAESQATADASVLEAEEKTPWRVLGTIHHFYIVVETEEGMLLIDQHAAHERVLFEEFLEQQTLYGRVASQGLLLPLELSLSADGYEVARDEIDAFMQIGYSYQFLQGRILALTEIPASLDPSSAEAFFQKTLEEMAKGKATPAISEQKRQERTLYQMACKAAIKGGRVYDESHIAWLCQKLQTLPDILVCPHGRPIAYLLSKKELDRFFGRI